MWQSTALLVVAILTVEGPAAPLLAQPQEPVVAPHPLVARRLERIASGSAHWRRDLARVGKLGRRVLVLTADARELLLTGTPGDVVDAGFLAETAPVPKAGGSIDEAVVVVNLPLLLTTHRRHGSLDGELEADLDRILVHEVYGHAVPYLLAGSLEGRCADPLPGERATEACSIRRENEVRQDLRLGQRRDYGLAGLVLGRLMMMR